MLLELAIGDAYGAGFEYASARWVKEKNDLSEYVRHPRHQREAGTYTDDTQMSIALAEALLSGEDWTATNLARRFVACFQRDRRTGYARHFQALLETVRDGEELLAVLKPDSDKSGAAMRACPLGVLREIPDLLERTRIQAAITHNTASGIKAAQAAALTVHYFLYNLGPRATLGEWLETILPPASGDDVHRWSVPYKDEVGPKGWMSVRAAITALTSSRSMSELLRSCIAFCGDVDTVATIALGAGSQSVELAQDLPEHLVERLENGTYGRDYLIELDQRWMELKNSKTSAQPK
jgi:ADP-ribosylglycohydrolase